MSGPLHRLAVVVTHPIQYYSPWFRQLAADGRLDLRVFFLSDHGTKPTTDRQFGRAFAWDTDLLSGFAHEFVPNTAARPDVTRFAGLRNPSLLPRLRAFAPDAILLFGYNYQPHLSVILRRPAPLLFRGDSHLLGAPPPSPVKRLLLRLVYSRFAAFLPVGSANEDYFTYYGVPQTKLFRAPHSVDDSHFQPTPDRLAAAAALRAQLGIPAGAPVVLFAGKLIAKKRPDLLLAAFRDAACPDAHLVFSGDGELEPALRAAASDLPHVHFLPFANQQAMPTRYLCGDVLALPSEGRFETWGLAVNEAMHLGRPALVSDHVGCHRDLIEPDVTGWVFPAGDRTALATTLRHVLTLPRAELVARGAAARARIANFTYSAATAGLLRALASLATRGVIRSLPTAR